MNPRVIIYVAAFLVALASAVAIAAYNLYGAFGLTPIPPGRMSVLSFIGLKDLQRGSFTSEALEPPAFLAYVLASAGLRDFIAVKGVAILSLAALPITGGLFAYVATRSKLVGGASALLLSFLPLSYLSALGGDYAFVSVMALVQLTVLTALLFLRVGRTPLITLWLGLSVVFAALTGMAVASASWLLFITLALLAVFSVISARRKRYLLVLFPGVVALTVNLIAPADPAEALRLISPITTVTQYATLLGILGVAGTAGAVSLWIRLRRDSVPALAFVATGLALTPFFWAEAFLLVLPGIVLLSMQSLSEAGRMVRVLKEQRLAGQEPVVLEVNFEKVVTLCLALITLSSPLVFGLGPGSAFQGANYLGPEELSTISQVQALSPSIFSQGAVAAPSSIAPWLRAETGVNTIPALTPEQAALADAISSTSFRLRSSQLMADEWTPFSSTRSPIIYTFDGSTYAPILHLDDGTNMVNFSYGGSSLRQDLSGMYLFSYSSSQSTENLTLTLRLTNFAFNVTKEVTLSTETPTLQISYVVRPNNGTALSSMTLPVYIEGEQNITSSVGGDTMNLNMSSSDVVLSFPGGSPPTLVRGGVQDYVKSNFNSTSGSIGASVTVDVPNAKSSGMGLFYASLLDEAASAGVSNFLTFTPPPGLNFLQSSIIRPALVLEVKDAFNRVLFTNNGANYVEAPAYAQVQSQNLTGACGGTVTYKTATLVIQKDMTVSNGSLSLSYDVRPWKANTTLQDMNVTLWIPSNRTVLSYHTTPGSVNLQLDSGPVRIGVLSGHLLGVEVGPDPVYHQPRVLLNFALDPTADKVGITMSFGAQLSCQQMLTTRPLMSGADELLLSADIGVFQQVYSSPTFNIYRFAAMERNP